MLWQPKRHQRRGSVLPLVAFMTVGLIGLVALAIDLSMVAVARNQCQNAADAAAMAASRSLNGDLSANNNGSQAVTDGKTAAKANKVLGKYITDSQVDVQIGILNYDKNT